MTTAAQSIETLEFERKFLLPLATGEVAAHCLDAFCRPDDRYRTSVVASIYYDTPGLRLLGEKVDSHLYKTKIRLRWYEDPRKGPVEPFCWLEMKSRVGMRRAKWRRRLDLPGRTLSTLALTDPALREVPEQLAHDATVAAQGLAPVLAIRYLRRRYVDPPSGARIALDRRITVFRVSPERLVWRGPVRLPQTVVEFKSAVPEPPPGLPFLAMLGARSTSFSKYHAGFEAMASSAASVA